MRAAYAALILGIVAGLVLATGVLSSRTDRETTTVAGVLALEQPGDDGDARRAEAVAVLTARCMTTRGFQWAPSVEPPPSIPDAELDPVTWAARWGFGVSTVVGRPEPVSPRDPNVQAVTAMPPDEGDAYRDALDGPAGCRTVATEHVYGLREREMAPVRASLRELDEKIAASPGAARATAAWAHCVGPVADGRPLEPRTLSPELRDAFVQRLARLGQVTGVVALQVEERRVATIMARCDVDYQRARGEVAAPFEAAFVAQHRRRLEATGAAIRSAEAALPTLPPWAD